ncbi:MAG: hydrogenase nickel incorporation protein HypA [Spirochaetota bacterium]
MHEYALAEAVVETVKREMAKRNAEGLVSVTLSLGELQNVDEEIFLAGLQLHLEGEPFDPSIFRLVKEPAVFSCRGCGGRWELADFPGITERDKEAIHFVPETARVYLSCPTCGSRDLHLEKGRGVYIQSMEVLAET